MVKQQVENIKNKSHLLRLKFIYFLLPLHIWSTSFCLQNIWLVHICGYTEFSSIFMAFLKSNSYSCTLTYVQVFMEKVVRYLCCSVQCTLRRFILELLLTFLKDFFELIFSFSKFKSNCQFLSYSVDFIFAKVNGKPCQCGFRARNEKHKD